MGHLLMSDAVGNFRKGVVSFWFRVPSETVAAVRTTKYDPFPFRVFGMGVIPLLTWGKQIDGNYWDAPTPMPPSYIGVRVGTSDYNWGKETLEVHLQTPDTASGGGSRWAPSGYPEYFGNSEVETSSPAGGYPAVLVDHWNHVILSWELSTASVVNGQPGNACKLWCSINDENKQGKDLPAMGPALNSMIGPNDHLSNHVRAFLASVGDDSSVTVSDVPSNPFAIPSRQLSYTTNSGGGIGQKNPIKRIEMAELQVFAGVALNTGNVANRRAFVDGDGLPVSPNASLDDEGNPLPPASAALLGKDAEIVLSGLAGWQEGLNVGTLGHDVEGETRPKGQFVPTGHILAWFPDPSLYGQQAPAPPPDV